MTFIYKIQLHTILRVLKNKKHLQTDSISARGSIQMTVSELQSMSRRRKSTALSFNGYVVTMKAFSLQNDWNYYTWLVKHLANIQSRVALFYFQLTLLYSKTTPLFSKKKKKKFYKSTYITNSFLITSDFMVEKSNIYWIC